VSKSDDDRRQVFDMRAVHVGAGFKEQERPHILEVLASLGPHLGGWDPDDVDVEVSMQDRGGKQQRVTLRTKLPGLPPLVAVADEQDLTRALRRRIASLSVRLTVTSRSASRWTAAGSGARRSGIRDPGGR